MPPWAEEDGAVLNEGALDEIEWRLASPLSSLWLVLVDEWAGGGGGGGARTPLLFCVGCDVTGGENA